MRTLLLSSALLAALGVATLTPEPAAAQGRARVTVSNPYYYPGTTYYSPSYYTPSYYYTPAVAPTYVAPYAQPYVYTAPTVPYQLNMVGPAPVYSGPQYF